MRKILLTLFSFILLSASVNAEVLLIEHFAQTTETLATNTDAMPYSGEIAASGWTNIMGASGYVYVNSSNDLTYSGYKSATDGTKTAEFKADYGKRVASPLTKSVNSGSVYMAGIVKISSMKSSGKDYLWALGVGTSGLNGASTKHYARPYVMQSGSGFKFGIAKLDETSTATYIDYTANEYAYGTYLIVVEYTWVDGDKNDVIKMYINPTKGAKPESATCVPKPTQASAKNDAASFGSVVLYSSNTSQAACLIDELKVVTDWADLWEEGEDPDPEPEPDPIGVPEPAASSITLSSATISWDAVEDADSYTLQWKVNGGSYSDDIAINKDVRSYSMSGLESETKYFVRVKTIVGEEASEWATINFNTSSEPDMLVYKDISFDKYSTQDAMPTSGQVFLAKNVVEYNNVTLTGNLTLNLHGKQIFLYGTHIIVPSGKTLTIYDDAGDGVITGGYPGDFLDKALISVKEGGTLVIGEGAVLNLADDSNDYNAAIDNNAGTIKLSGAPNISGVKTDIYLNSNAITIESGKPLTNTTPYKVFRLSGVFTAGWANMGGEKPGDYFVSSASNRSVCLGASGEGQIVSAFTLSENSNNSDIATYSGELSNISFVRSLVSSQYNTFCLPFALDDDQLQEFFGAGYDLEELSSSSLDGELLTLVFNRVYELESGKPYLLQPASNVADPSFEGVTITATSPVNVTTSCIDFKPVYAPTELTGGDKNTLFLGAGNELFYPSTTANIKAFRAYFEVKGDAQKAAKRARIVKKEDAATGVDQITNDKLPMTNKILRNGEILILRDGKTYNVIGQMVK